MEDSTENIYVDIGAEGVDSITGRQGCQPPTSSNIENMIGSQEDDR